MGNKQGRRRSAKGATPATPAATPAQTSFRGQSSSMAPVKVAVNGFGRIGACAPPREEILSLP